MLPVGANLQKIRNGNKTYAITPHLPGGFIKPEALRKYADVAETFGGVLKLTSAQRIMITGLKAEDIEAVWQELGMKPALGFANCVRSVKICPGDAFCKRGKRDSIKIGLELDRLYIKQEMPSRMKIGVAGCQNSCAEVHIKDIGLMASDKGWDVYVGGSAGAHPRLANKLISDLEEDAALRMVSVVIDYYKKNAEIERMGQFIDRIGFDTFKADVLGLFIQGVSASMVAEPPEQQGDDRGTPLPGAFTSGTLSPGDAITADSIIADIIRVYPQTIPVFRSFGMGCLGCPSATGEALSKACEIHSIDLTEIIGKLNAVTA